MTKLQPRAHSSPHFHEAHEREHAFLERARAGEDVRNEVLLHMQRPLYTIARRMHWRYSQQQGNVVEVGDLVQEASAEILACFSVALTKEEPFPYLYRLASIAMLNCVNSRSRIIKTHPSKEAIPILSLDQAVTSEGVLLADILAETFSPHSEQVSSLGQVVETLPERQRAVIQRCFGLNEHAPESLNQISKLFSVNPRTRSAHHHYHQALETLRQKLSAALPQYSTAGGTR
jgi:RNA polymerase sigma factor (sigma-70 family)